MVNVYDVGDVAPLRLEVAPSATDTVATVVVYSPSNLERALAAAPSADRGTWETSLELTEAGTWRTRWTVTGTGAGVEWHDLYVRPDRDAAGGGRMYATTADLAEWTGQAPNEASPRALRRASRRVDDMLRTAVYPVDDAGMPTDPVHRQALADATCAQVEWWDEIGDDGNGAVAALAGGQIGSVRLPGASGGSGGGGGIPVHAPEAWAALARAGLTGQGPRIPGHGGGRRG